MTLGILAATLALAACNTAKTDSGPAKATQPPNGVALSITGANTTPQILPGSTITFSARALRADNSGAAPGDHFAWTAVVEGGGSYRVGSGVTTAPCAEVTKITSSGGVDTYTPDLSADISASSADQSNVTFRAPESLPPPPDATISTAYPYCVTIRAQAITSDPSAKTPTGPSASLTFAVLSPSSLAQ